jgi:hypothetical protein
VREEPGHETAAVPKGDLILGVTGQELPAEELARARRVLCRIDINERAPELRDFQGD